MLVFVYLPLYVYVCVCIYVDVQRYSNPLAKYMVVKYNLRHEVLYALTNRRTIWAAYQMKVMNTCS